MNPEQLREARNHVVRVRQQALAFVLVLGNAGILAYGVHLAGKPWAWWRLWTAVAMGSQCLVLLAVWRRWTARLADPSLTVPQIALMLLLTAAAYPLAGPLRALVVPVMMLVLAFGMFQPPGPVMVRLSLFALVLTWIAIAFDLHRGDDADALWVSLGHALFALICFPGIAVLALRVAHMRQRLLEQRRGLAEAVARIERLATRDPLTDLHNRRHGALALEQAWQRQQRRDSGVCLVLIDLDHFKLVNDRFGHAAGDAVLRGFADVLRQSLRAGDVAMRWGGEEFLVLLEPIEPGGSRTWVERLRKLQAEQRRTLPPDSPHCSFSAGVANWRAQESVEACLERADRSLYAAKACGRNRVEGDA